MQTECWQTCELSNFPGVRLICGRDFKMSDMNFFTPVALLSVLLFFAVKMSLGREFSENHVPVKFISTLTYQQHTLMYGNRQFPRIYNAIRWYLGYFCAKFGNLRVFFFSRRIWQQISQEKNGTCIGLWCVLVSALTVGLSLEYAPLVGPIASGVVVSSSNIYSWQVSSWRKMEPLVWQQIYGT